MKKDFFKLDYICILIAVALSTIGIFVVFSATLGQESLKKTVVQIFAVVLGLLLMLLVSGIDYRVYKSYKTHIYALSVFILLFVILFGSGKEETGANSWIRFSGIGVQPSEFVKIAFGLVFSAKISEAKESGTLNSFKVLSKLFFSFLGIVFLVILQNDTGTALVFAFMFFIMLFIGGISYKYILWALGVALLLIPVAWLFMAPYQRDRILVFLNPGIDPQGAGYQVTQSKISIGSGGFLGRGYLNGPQNRLSLLPENETDFIFSTIGEELGFLGCITVVVLLLGFILRIFTISKNAKSIFGELICVSYGAMFLFHTVENIGMCLGLLPVTGIPLTFLSYGGSSVVSSYIVLGIILNVYKVSKKLCFNKYD